MNIDEKGFDIEIRRLFKASKERLWMAWTDPEMFKKWWGPKDFTAPFSRIDLRVGGKILASMRGPDGKDYWSTGTYREIVPNQRLVMTDSFSDEKGNIVPASTYGMPGDWNLVLHVTVTLEERDGGTIMTLNHKGFPSKDMAEQAKEGWNQSFDKLEEALGNDRIDG